MQTTIGFIGAGNMATAIIQGLLQQGISGERIVAFDPNSEHLQNLHERFHMQIAQNNADVIEHANVVVLAVKPQVMKAVIEPIIEDLRKNKPLIISIAAGITLGTFKEWIGNDVPVVRVMPNTPGLLGEGASGLYASKDISLAQKDLAELIFQSIGTTLWVDDEDLLHAVTAVSGSGPAYFFTFLEAMISKGVQLGLDVKQARDLAAQTCLGAAKMAKASPLEIGELKQNVMSKGGTTERAVQHFEKSGLGDMVDGAMQACVDRRLEMSKEIK